MFHVCFKRVSRLKKKTWGHTDQADLSLEFNNHFSDLNIFLTNQNIVHLRLNNVLIQVAEFGWSFAKCSSQGQILEFVQKLCESRANFWIPVLSD